MIAIKQHREKNTSVCILRFESVPMSRPSGCITGLGHNSFTGTDWRFHHDPVTKSSRYTVQIDFPTRRLPPGWSVTSVGHVHTVMCIRWAWCAYLSLELEFSACRVSKVYRVFFFSTTDSGQRRAGRWGHRWRLQLQHSAAAGATLD